MKMFKRFAAALLAGVMVLAMLTACGGAGASTIGEEFENKYIATLNTLRGEDAEELENDTVLHDRALAQLAKINEDGTIVVTDAYTYITTPNADGKSVTVVAINVATKGDPVNGVVQAEEITAASLDKITTDGADESAVAAMRALKKIGIATKVINGKTYAAIAIEMVQPVSNNT